MQATQIPASRIRATPSGLRSWKQLACELLLLLLLPLVSCEQLPIGVETVWVCLGIGTPPRTSGAHGTQKTSPTCRLGTHRLAPISLCLRLRLRLFLCHNFWLFVVLVSFGNSYVTTYDVKDSDLDFSYATVRLAGHMVPTFMPAASLSLFSRFLANQPL